MAAARCCVALLVVVALASLTACNGESFQGGIAVTASEGFADMPGTTAPVPGVPDSGLSSYNDVFSGVTDANGVDQHPSAPVNRSWTVDAEFGVVIAA
jgi:hypothetical protein